MTQFITTKPVVLVVDDNEQTSSVIQEMLELMDFDVEIATDGRIAVEMTGAKAYAIVLMDVEMPVMDGLAATTAIRSQELAELMPPVPIVGITGHTDTGTRMLCQRAGMTDVMLKPFAMSKLEEKLKTLCGQRLN